MYFLTGQQLLYWFVVAADINLCLLHAQAHTGLFAALADAQLSQVATAIHG